MEDINIQDNSGDKKYFTLIPNYILNHSSANDQALYLQMKRIAGDNGKCFASVRYFMKQLKVGQTAIKNSITYLVEHGWIEYVGKTERLTKGGVQLANTYKVNDIWKLNNEFFQGVSEKDPLSNKGVSEKRSGCIQEIPQGVSETISKKNPLSKNYLSKNNSVAPINEIISYFFDLKGWGNKSKDFYAKNKIIYSRYTKSAKELYFLCDNDIEEVNKCLDIMAKWADSRELDWGIETIFKKWYDIDKLKPKEKKPYYEGNRVFDMAGKKYVLMPNGDKLQFAGSTSSLKYK